jgi:hypothetical protein
MTNSASVDLVAKLTAMAYRELKITLDGNKETRHIQCYGRDKYNFVGTEILF